MSAVVRRLPQWMLWSGTMAVVTFGMISARGQIDQAHVALVYLLVILGGSASGGRGIGVALAFVGFISIDYFFQPPFGSFGVGKRPDWLVLIAFLATALVATQLLARANEQASAARRRADEIDRLSALGAETLSVGRAEDALSAIAEVIRDTIGATTCELFIGGDAASLRRAALAGDPAAVPPEGTAADARTVIVPLVVHSRTVGELRLSDSKPIVLQAEERRFLSALSYYAALGVERVRLVAEAEHAEALREADRLKDALLAAVSHDLRTPLTTIKALAHDIAGAGDERATVIEQQADRLNRVVADLLELSRLNAGELPVRPELNAAEDLVGAAIQQVSHAFEGREIRTSIAWSEPVLVGRFDFVHALRIIVNLLENAAKYSPRGAPVDVEITRDGEWLAISVADRGAGVPPSERERIFEPFYRLPGVSPDVGGAGLGLAISRRLAIVQGGSVSYSERPGGGSIFTVRLPAASLDGAMPADALARPVPGEHAAG